MLEKKYLKDSKENNDIKELFKRTKANYDLDNFSLMKEQITFFLDKFIDKLEFMLKISKEKEKMLI